MNRRTFLYSVLGASVAAALHAQGNKRILLRSSWQTVNIGDIAHTPGMLALLEMHLPTAEVTLWPSSVDRGVDKILLARFPKLKIALSPQEKLAALKACDFFLHGSGPGLVGAKETLLARQIGKPYGFGGITLNDQEIEKQHELLAGAKFVFLRDTDSMRALLARGLKGPRVEFGPDATFALDLRNEAAADKLMAKHKLEQGKFLVAVPRLRYTPYWEIHPDKRKPDPKRIAINQEFVEKDHAKLREGIIAWVRATKMRVLLAPEMTYALALLRPLLFEPLPADVKQRVAIMSHYWLTDEAASLYARAAAIISLEQHSPIMAIAAGVPAVLVRQPTDTRKGQMWYDLQLNQWVFEIDNSSGAQIARCVEQIARDLPAARQTAAKARAYAQQRMAAMMAALAHQNVVTGPQR